MKSIKLWQFWIIVSIIYCAVVLTFEFRGVPVGDFYSFCVTAAQFCVVAVCTSGLLMLLVADRWVFVVLFPLLSIISGIMCYYNVTIGTRLTPMSLEIALVNNMTMWLTMISWGVVVVGVISAAIGIAAAYIRFRKVESGKRERILFALVGLVIVLLPTLFVRKIKSPVTSRLPYSIYYSFKEYLGNRKSVKEFRDTYAASIPETSEVKPDIIVVIGESLRADHVPMNGYFRNTMPILSKAENLVSYPNIYSEYTFTEESVPHLMTCKKSGGDKDSAFEEQSFITLFKNAGYRTAWFANQELGSSFTYFGHEADSLVYVNADRSLYSYEKWYDEDIIPHLKSWLDEKADDAPVLAVVHTIGSHWWYKSHYSDTQSLFLPEITHKDIGGLTDDQIVNSYDNTIVATDAFLSSIYDMVRDRNAVVFYVSDHGEALGEEGTYFHGADIDAIHNPACMIMYSPEYEVSFPEKVEAMRNNASRADSTDLVFHTVLDLAGLKTGVLNETKSLVSGKAPQ